MSDVQRYRIYWRDEGTENFMCVDPGFPEVNEAEEVHVVLESAYDALAREVEGLKAALIELRSFDYARWQQLDIIEKALAAARP